MTLIEIETMKTKIDLAELQRVLLAKAAGTPLEIELVAWTSHADNDYRVAERNDAIASYDVAVRTDDDDREVMLEVSNIVDYDDADDIACELERILDIQRTDVGG